MYDNIIIGSGLCALATAMGLDDAQSTLVISGAPDGALSYYPNSNIPCASDASGGLGQYWHGVIPLGDRFRHGVPDTCTQELFEKFFPRSSVQRHAGQDYLFVPWAPIRPEPHWKKLREQRQNLHFRPGIASGFDVKDTKVTLRLGSDMLTCKRLWIAAGATRTPGLIETSLNQTKSPRHISDHVIGCIGQIDYQDRVAPLVKDTRRLRSGLVLPAFPGLDGDPLFSVRPARFDFRRLDANIEKREVFGLPTAKLVTSVIRKLSPGLISEAAFNKAGVGRKAKRYNVYYQARVQDLYRLKDGELHGPSDTLQSAEYIEGILRNCPFQDLERSKRLEVTIPGVHLHGSLHDQEIDLLNTDSTLKKRVKVVDPSVIKNIGAEHHSFRVMARAYFLAHSPFEE